MVQLSELLNESHAVKEIAKLNNPNENSHFTGFLDYSLDWTRDHEDNTGITEYIYGELHVSTQRGFTD